VLGAHLSGTGTTAQMAEYIAEGIRIAGHEADVTPIVRLRGEDDLKGYDGYVFGCPTYHLGMPPAFEAFLMMARGAGLRGKAGGAFSPRAHPSSSSGGAARDIYSFMESDLGMAMCVLGPFDVETRVMGGPRASGPVRSMANRLPPWWISVPRRSGRLSKRGGRGVTVSVTNPLRS
jgi:multimeric flavodoxin WrbA